MKKSTKAVMLSTFVFPGLGHLYLKKRLAGSVLIGTSFVAIYYLISTAATKAMQVAEKIQSGDVPIDTVAITEMLSKQTTGAEIQLENAATAVFIICWIIGITDAYRVGCAREENRGNRVHTESRH